MIVVPTVLFVVVLAAVTITVTSACVYLCTKKCSVKIQTISTARSTEMPTKKIKFNNGTKDESCYETEFQEEHIYEHV